MKIDNFNQKLFCLNFHLKTELGPKIRRKFCENFFFLDVQKLFFVEKQKVLKFVGLESKISGLRGLFTCDTRMSWAIFRFVRYRLLLKRTSLALLIERIALVK